MAIKLADTVEPMGDFPAVNSTDVNINIDGIPKNLQDAFDDGDFGGGLETAEQALSVASTASLQTAELEQNVALYNSYSLNETFTGGTWINGKKIYKKTFDMGNIPAPSSGNTFVRIPFNVDFEDIIDIKGMIVPNASSTEAQKEYYSIPKPPKVGQSSYNVSLKIKPYNNVLNLELETNSELNNKKAYATVYYTKVND